MHDIACTNTHRRASPGRADEKKERCSSDVTDELQLISAIQTLNRRKIFRFFAKFGWTLIADSIG